MKITNINKVQEIQMRTGNLYNINNAATADRSKSERHLRLNKNILCGSCSGGVVRHACMSICIEILIYIYNVHQPVVVSLYNGSPASVTSPGLLCLDRPR